jgi:3'-phosphoadenosine 5'-phosphosulfate sulfotransferase (PAPS reductase)/FAD synthetase
MAAPDLSREFLAEWEAHVVREQKRADEQVARQIAMGTRQQKRRLRTLPDFSQKAPDSAVLLPLAEYDHVIVSFSGGKDSLACVLHLLDLGVPREKIELWHQAVDGEPGKAPRFFDWPVTEHYCRAVAKALGIRLLFQWRIGGFEVEINKTNTKTKPIGFELPSGGVDTAGGVMSKVRTRKEFPKPGSIAGGRWCSAILKQDVSRLTLNNDPRFARGRTLVLSGERGEESKNRAQYAAVKKFGFSFPDVLTDPELWSHEEIRANMESVAAAERKSPARITEWRPLLAWYEPHVWQLIRKHRINPHPAYLAGFSRVSCLPCIFGNDDQWATVEQLDPKLMKKIAGYEHEFRDYHDDPKRPGSIHKKYDVLQRAVRGISYLREEIPKAELADAVAHAKMAMAEHYNQPVFVKKWVIPRGAGRGSGGPT